MPYGKPYGNPQMAHAGVIHDRDGHRTFLAILHATVIQPIKEKAED